MGATKRAKKMGMTVEETRAAAEARAAEMAANPSVWALKRMNKEDLQERCRRANLSDVGSKGILVDALLAKKRKWEDGVDSSEDANEFSLPGVGQTEQVPYSNITQHGFEEWFEETEGLEDEV